MEVFQDYRWDPRNLDLVRNIDGDVSFWALQDLPRLPRWSRRRVILVATPRTHRCLIRDSGAGNRRCVRLATRYPWRY